MRGKSGQRAVHIDIDIEVAGVADLVGCVEDFPEQPAPGGRGLVLQHFQQRQNEDEEAPAQVPVPAQTSRNREEALQPCFQLPRAVVRRPVLELRPAGCPTAFHGEQAHADRGAPGDVEFRQAGRAPDRLRSLDPDDRGRGRHVLLAQHAFGGQGPLPAPSPASQ